jgi:hypothetical protein
MSLTAECLVCSPVDEVADGGCPASSIGGAGGDGEIGIPDGKFTPEEPGELMDTGMVVTGSIFLATISPPSSSANSVADRKSSMSPRRRSALPRSDRLATGL